MTRAAPTTLLAAAGEVLAAAEPPAKTAAADAAIRLLNAGAPVGDLHAPAPPMRPARPERPRLVPPADVPRRRLGSEEGRAALLHAIGHIEFNAIDLAFDMAARFAPEADRLGLNVRNFLADWFAVGGEEARHFGLIEARLGDFGRAYGDFQAHNGLWEAAEKTAGGLAARLVVAPLILEARGLDVTPDMIARLRAAGDENSAGALEVIYRDEIGHVACGKRWFQAVCQRLGQDPARIFHDLRKRYFSGEIKPPFNYSARDAAGLPRTFYERNGKENP